MSLLTPIICWGESFKSLTDLSKDSRCLVPYELLWGRLSRQNLSPELAATSPLGPTSKNCQIENETETTKYCISCTQIKSLKDFTTDKRGRKGKRGSCKVCVLKSRQNSNYKNNQRKSNLKRYHKFSEEQYQFLFNQQNGLCAACGQKPLTGYNNHLYVDHNHETKEVCGLLCLRCNVAAGMLDDDWHKALKLTQYLKCTHFTTAK